MNAGKRRLNVSRYSVVPAKVYLKVERRMSWSANALPASCVPEDFTHAVLDVRDGAERLVPFTTAHGVLDHLDGPSLILVGHERFHDFNVVLKTRNSISQTNFYCGEKKVRKAMYCFH